MMEEKDFEKRWKTNRQKLLSKDQEWQRLQESYKMDGGADWLLFAIPAVVGMASFNYIPSVHELLKWLISAIITIVCFAICVWIKSLIVGAPSADAIEKRIKEDYRKSLENDCKEK